MFLIYFSNFTPYDILLTKVSIYFFHTGNRYENIVMRELKFLGIRGCPFWTPRRNHSVWTPFLYPPHRGYISFVNTFVTPRNNDLCSLETFDQRKILRLWAMSVCPSVRPVCGKHDCVRPQRATDLKKNLHIGFYYPYAGWYWKWAISVHRIRSLPYKSNRYTGVLSTWNVRFTPNLIFRLVYQL